MTQQEFADLAGRDIKAPNFIDEYTLADRIYMAAGNVDKQTFCADYKKSGASATMCALTEVAERRFKIASECKATMISTARNLMDVLGNIPDAEVHDYIYQQAIKLIGIKDCVQYKLEKRMELCDEDRNYLLASLK